ncbi:hypothetical protein amb1987 [Paramagnetospirillum magneticum AMB-1]|uniref:Hemerythrin-like domain-containing protein n=2 Tax=Paramagnetospirillum magneticum TaxID=84159 RepID=Q2W5T4_PARM1|nr:hypothetical protein amb1987 [Paramagnetospirillum magneticum AMB-1]
MAFMVAARSRPVYGVTNMEWHEMMSVGVAEFDEDHKRVIVLLTEIHEALDLRQVGRASELAAELLKLATAHTEREEVFLRRIGFPDVELVTNPQKESLTRITELVCQFDQNTVAADDAILEMRLSFIDYLLSADINYKSYVKSKGLSDC